METTQLTGDELSKAVAIALGKTVYHDDELVIVGRFDYANDYLIDDRGAPCPIPEYATDANTAFTLTVEGWLLSIKEWVEVGKPNSWLAQYYSNSLARGVGCWDVTPAEAICKARLALAEYISSKKT